MVDRDIDGVPYVVICGISLPVQANIKGGNETPRTEARAEQNQSILNQYFHRYDIRQSNLVNEGGIEVPQAGL